MRTLPSLLSLPQQNRWLARALPSSCALCGMQAGAAVCEACRSAWLQDEARRCDCCAIPLPLREDAARCGACLQSPPAFDATLAAIDYRPPVDQLVHGLKFRGQLALAPLFAGLMRNALLTRRARDAGQPEDAAGQRRGPELSLPEILLPVPLGPRRLAERGFNQALEIARVLQRSLGIALEPRLLQRERETLAQSLLHPDQRGANIAGAFGLSGTAQRYPSVRGLHVGVVDDVMTTGATLQEVALTLKMHGAARVTNLVFARTPK